MPASPDGKVLSQCCLITGPPPSDPSLSSQATLTLISPLLLDNHLQLLSFSHLSQGPSHISTCLMESHLHPVSTLGGWLILASDPVDCSLPSPAWTTFGCCGQTLSSSHQGQGRHSFLICGWGRYVCCVRQSSPGRKPSALPCPWL